MVTPRPRVNRLRPVANPDQPLLLTKEQVAKRLQISERQVGYMIEAGRLPVVRIGRLVRVPAAALREWVLTNTEQPEPAGWVRR